MKIDTTRLRALAKAATPGPWNAGKYGIAGGDDFTTPVVSWDYAWADCANEPDDKPFIAACSPDVILALLDEVDRLRAEGNAAAVDPKPERPVVIWHYRDDENVLENVVDVRPEPWHARLVRLAQEERDASKACAEAEAAFKVADAERERTRLVRAAAREACHAARKALTEATTAAAIVEAAQQPASVQPTRPEPRYKVGDWVRVVTGPNSAGRTTPIRVTCVTSAGYIMADGASWAAENLTPALDPALHETARTAARMLLCGKWPLGLPRVRELPGFDAWNLGPLKSSEWAAQLERLLGDAP